MALLAFSGIFAQSVKLGYVNTDRILLDSNEAAEISRLFNLDRQNWTNQVREMDSSIQQMERDFEIRRLSISEASKRELQGKIDAKKQEAGRLLEEYFGEGGRAELRYRELIDPLTKIAVDENYTMILDVSMGVVLYATPSIDITDQILQELNKDTIKPAPDPNLDTPAFPDPKDPFGGGSKDGFNDGFNDGFGFDNKAPEFKP
jgi:outer membrane protein